MSRPVDLLEHDREHVPGHDPVALLLGADQNCSRTRPSRIRQLDTIPTPGPARILCHD